MTKTVSIYALAVSLLFVGAVIMLKPLGTDGAGWIGFQSHLQSATTTTVGPDEVVTLFADQSNPTCHSRVVSTGGSGIHISFDDTTGFGSTSLAANIGHYQGASTTVAYDSGLYGCGLMSAWGYASDTVTISSF